jgi:beta-phosphoglucomutase
MIKAILFDMDGVLIEAKDWHYEALNKALSHFGYHISRESHLTTFDGLPTKKKLQMLHESRGLPIGLKPLINQLKQRYTLQISSQKCRPTFNHQYALSKLNAEGYSMAVCSNSIAQTIDAMLLASGLDEYFSHKISNEDVSQAKPDPEMYLKAMSFLKVPASECLILEDNDHGIQAALASGAHLLKIGTPDDVTYQNIKNRIHEIESQK